MKVSLIENFIPAMTTIRTECGTPRGYSIHQNVLEIPCERCLIAQRSLLRGRRPCQVTP